MVWNEDKGGWGCLPNGDPLNCMLLWALTAFPLVCRIFIFFSVILGRTSQWKVTSSTDSNTTLSLFFKLLFFRMDTNSQFCMLKKQLCKGSAVRIWICSTINKSQEETLTIIERKYCGCTVGIMRVQLFLFITSKNKEWTIFVSCPIEKKEQQERSSKVPDVMLVISIKKESCFCLNLPLVYSHLRTWTETRESRVNLCFCFGFFFPEVALTHQVSMLRTI